MSTTHRSVVKHLEDKANKKYELNCLYRTLITDSNMLLDWPFSVNQGWQGKVSCFGLITQLP